MNEFEAAIVTMIVIALLLGAFIGALAPWVWAVSLKPMFLWMVM